MESPDPSRILQVGTGFFAAKTLLSAAELGLFTELARRPMTGPEIASALRLHSRAIPDFPDALVALGLLDRDGDGPAARYQNTPDGAVFLDRESPDYVGGLLEMASARLYPFWGDLTEALQTGRPQNEFGDAFDYTAADFIGWCREAGFRRFEVLPLEGASSAAVAYK